VILFSCPACSTPLALKAHECPSCGTAVALHPPSRRMVQADGFDIDVDGTLWHPCANRREWRCNWLVADQTGARCFACQLVRRRPDADDTLANEKLADALADQHRLLVQLQNLGIPVDPWFEADGGLGFDLLSSRSANERIVIGHASGIVTLDLLETVDEVREGNRVRLGEAYRTMLGHYRHEVGHYYQWILVEQTGWIDECRGVFGDERASYSDAIARHYRTGAPRDWEESFISEYATMHPWEDFAETFAHYLHITGVLQTSAASGLVLDTEGPVPPEPVRPRSSYGPGDFAALMGDWRWASAFFNQVNRSIGMSGFYPFRITTPVEEKLRFVHRVLTDLPPTRIEPTDGFARRID
jgi:hypothetical protein